MARQLAPHEALELHEVMRTETLSLTKMTAMLPIVADEELKTFMQESMNRKQAALQQMRSFATAAAQAAQNTAVGGMMQ